MTAFESDARWRDVEERGGECSGGFRGHLRKPRAFVGIRCGYCVRRVRRAPVERFQTFICYKTNDYAGRNLEIDHEWHPQNQGVIHTVREHPRNRDLLFAGGEFGLFISFDRGEHWRELKNNLPRVPVDDIAIHPRENDLILATHGRSVWILDSIAIVART